MLPAILGRGTVFDALKGRLEAVDAGEAGLLGDVEDRKRGFPQQAFRQAHVSQADFLGNSMADPLFEEYFQRAA